MFSLRHVVVLALVLEIALLMWLLWIFATWPAGPIWFDRQPEPEPWWPRLGPISAILFLAVADYVAALGVLRVASSVRLLRMAQQASLMVVAAAHSVVSAWILLTSHAEAWDDVLRILGLSGLGILIAVVCAGSWIRTVRPPAQLATE